MRTDSDCFVSPSRSASRSCKRQPHHWGFRKTTKRTVRKLPPDSTASSQPPAPTRSIRCTIFVLSSGTWSAITKLKCRGTTCCPSRKSAPTRQRPISPGPSNSHHLRRLPRSRRMGLWSGYVQLNCEVNIAVVNSSLLCTRLKPTSAREFLYRKGTPSKRR
jgi:hypothetical protein